MDILIRNYLLGKLYEIDLVRDLNLNEIQVKYLQQEKNNYMYESTLEETVERIQMFINVPHEKTDSVNSNANI